MKNCINTEIEEAPLDPRKRVRYAFGMVLGVDDFRQEQVYFAQQQALAKRLLHGAGTVSGLRVGVAASADGSDAVVSVSAGYALSPKGRWIYVDTLQCGRLDNWLQTNKATANPPLGIGPRRIYVTLGYDECPTDQVPIAARACAAAEDSQAPSRVAAGFKLGFAWHPPAQPAEEGMRAFGELLRLVEIVATVSPAVDDGDAFLDAVRALGQPDSPPVAPSPPDGIFQLPAADAEKLLRQAQVVWATEVAPRLDAAAGDDILLAALDFTLDGLGRLVVTAGSDGVLAAPGSVTVDESDRPVLLSSRVQQEWLTAFGRWPGL
jgi:hypothetical protein